MNILVLMTDHQRCDALGCCGNPLAHTPNLDRLAGRSVRFDNCFTQAPVCAPARHSLATGRYVHAHGVLTNRHQPHPGMFTIAHALAPRGYRRFHLGHMHWTDREMDNGYEPEVTAEMWHKSIPAAAFSRYQAESQAPIRRTTGGPSSRTREQYWGYHVATSAIKQIEEVVARGESFLSWTSFTEPHPPFYPPKEFYALNDPSTIELPEQPPADAPPPHKTILSKQQEWKHLTEYELRQIIAGYYGMVALVDGYIGMVIDAIDRLGIRDQTAIIWTADHGDQMAEHGMFLKFQMREASVHVPLYIDLPGCDAGAREELVEHIDLFPTLCEIAGAACPEAVHGRSLLPLLKGEPAPEPWRDAVFSQIGTTEMIRTEKWKLNVYDGTPGELYDLENDPKEFYNRINDPACADPMQSLFGRLKEWERRYAPEA